MTTPKAIEHGLSFDVECYYQITSKDYLDRDRPPTPEVARNTHGLLDTLAERGIKATFFTLGNVARRFPTLLRRMATEGHEIGVHGDTHQAVDTLTAARFHDEIRAAIDDLQSASGQRIVGHRAPAFSIGAANPWALDVLRVTGLQYDSSIYPIQNQRYGDPEAPVWIHTLDNGLVEVPLTTITLHTRRLPTAGGGYFRLFPRGFTRWALDECERLGRPAITYFHPHEFELSKPKTHPIDWLQSPLGSLKLLKFNTIQGIGRGEAMQNKLDWMLDRYTFAPLRNLLPATC